MATPDDEPRIVEHLKPAFDEPVINRVWRSIEGKRSPGSVVQARRPLLIAALAATLCALAILAVLTSGRLDAPLNLADARAVPAMLGDARSKAAYRLDDGSQIALAPGAQMAVLRNDGRELVTVLRKGKSTFDVRPGGKRRWTIEVGVLTVEVLGTRFVVERSASQARVVVERGVVLVRGERVPDRAIRLSAGQSFSLAAADTTQATSTPVEQAAVPALSPAPEVTAAPVASTQANGVMPVPSEPTWLRSARRGAYAEAFRALESEDLASTIREAEDATTLLALADVARKSSAHHTAALALREVLRREPHGTDATLAAFTLGKLELEQLNLPEAAAAHFAWVLQEGGTSSLVEDALARLVDADVKRGAPAAARAHATEYIERFPVGRWRDSVDRLLRDLP